MPTGTILVVDDEIKLRSLLRRIISMEGYSVYEAADLKSAAKLVHKENIEVIVCDVKLPDGNGIEFTRHIKTKASAVEIILLTGHGNITDGVTAIKNGAFDYITKGNDNDKLLPLIGHAVEKARLQKRVWQLEKQVTKVFGFYNIIGESEVICDAVALAKKVAPLNTTVLLLGETGTGKELFAKGIHVASPRAYKPFVALNCSSFSKDLLESELFGHKAGAFTGAVKDKKGLMEEAGGGTLFLDEIGEMHIDLQAKLLRVLETNEYIKVGDTVPTKADVRVISATNRDLQGEVAEGKFRQDLYYRLNVFSLNIAQLRERKKDIPLIAKYFMKLFAEKMNKNIEGMTKEFIYYITNQAWKGNIRELKNTIERAVIMADHPMLSVGDLPVEIQLSQPEKNKPISAFDLASIEKLHIQRVLNYTKGNKPEAAKLLEYRAHDRVPQNGDLRAKLSQPRPCWAASCRMILPIGTEYNLFCLKCPLKLTYLHPFFPAAGSSFTASKNRAMVEVFKTDVRDRRHAYQLVEQIHETFGDYTANFDLHDCDRILRVKCTTGFVQASQLVELLKDYGCHAEVLPD